MAKRERGKERERRKEEEREGGNLCLKIFPSIFLRGDTREAGGLAPAASMNAASL